ncbi:MULTISPECIES: site-specific DNA-methyltransferase [unclassified Paracoccus (in: a-proteobacteria)]|uniref:site-specific DNA-methyltransferase n=1 Tax=unclassified Paracoccus (in: a-proteobacteria) TaxID=2688777 RepID=UPI0012B3AC51|nr:MULTISPECIES: site-specific DNA-methyltransferase [unclassified Paracoccus (in: a-proteobacteria)]UXU75536.1 site-specific DNA-methyltransferase [Paracoccus sp. SMMA_5]UXU81441.1 site-specific DNA-methyltransferase [Paracoccus sp. SMMA_5_TC]
MGIGALQVEYRDTSALVPFVRNPRLHPDWQIAQIAASITKFGFVNPILVGGDGVLIAGHGRLLAAQRLGLQQVPVIVLGHLSEAERRALLVADNRIAENAAWDEELLRSILGELREEAFDLEVIGFSDEELAELFGGLEDESGRSVELGDPDFVPEPPSEPVTRVGDLWILGEHRVLCGDATRAADLQRLTDGRFCDAMWTDPPYNVAYEGKAGRIANDDLSATDFARFLVSAFSAAAQVLAPGAAVYVAHSETEGLAFRRAFRDAGFKLTGCLVWVKPSLVLGRSDYQWRHEPILYGWKPGAAHRWFGGRAKTTVFDQPGAPVRVMPDGTVQVDVGGQVLVISGRELKVEAHEGSVIRAEKPARNAEHPTMKPISLILEMLENSTRRGDVVLDPFGGSGSTLIACHRSGRSARLTELEPRYADVIVERWQTFTGQRAVLEGDGRSFAEVAAGRRRAA